MTRAVEHSIEIRASPSAVWAVLTDHALMKQWMGDAVMDVDVATDWTVGSSIVISGFHHVRSESRGVVLAFEPPTRLRFSQLSSLSGLPDVEANRSVIELRLAPTIDGTSLTIALSRFPNVVIEKHLALYWRGTLEVLKQFVEERQLRAP
jgi:uncharacterized protein YndB with AHSA1/START domain